MARRGNRGNGPDDNSGTEDTGAVETPTEAVPDTTVETPTDAVPATPADDDEDEAPKAELTDEQIAEAISGFVAAAETASEARDESTGTVPEAQIAEVNKAYAALDGIKLKNAAKRYLNEALKGAMNVRDVVKARSFMDLNENLKATGSKKAGKAREPKAPVDPTEAFVERVTVLNLAAQLVGEVVPEGVAEDWADKAETLIGETNLDQIAAYRTWLLSDAEDKGDAPEVSATIQAAVKLSLGRSAKPGKAPKRAGGNGGGSTYDGPRRDIGKHILEAFADKPSGHFMLISDIRKFKSSEYGDDHPSAGAISSRLFPNSGGPCTVEGVTQATNEKGDKGGVKD